MKCVDRSLGHLDRPIAFHRVFVNVTGSVTSALFLSQVLYWQRRCPAKREGWWWKTAEDWQEETCLTHAQQKKARKTLARIGVLEEVKKGIPCRLWFRLNEAKLWEVIKCTELRQTEKKEIQVNRGRDGKFVSVTDSSMPQSRVTISETSTETSTEISTQPASGGKGLVLNSDKKKKLKLEQQFGVQVPESISGLQNIDRVTKVLKKEKLASESVRLLFAEFEACCLRSSVKDKWALFADLARKAASGKLALSELGEKKIPPWH